MNKNDIILDATRDGGVVKFNLDDAKGQIADQIRAFLLNMMPAAAFDSVIDVAFKKLTEPRPEVKNNYGTVTQKAGPSELEEMVMDEMRRQLSVKIAEWGKRWRDTPDAERARDETMNLLVQTAAREFMTNVSHSIVSQAISAVRMDTGMRKCESCGKPAPIDASCNDCGHWNYR